ncbi:MAG: hypothetical protein QM655_02410 [Nocardioidaceae bacterium]
MTRPMTGRALAALAALLTTALAAGLAVAGFTTPARAIPPGGASPDTPGTSATVANRTLQPGAVIHFTVTGFPAGEVVYVKIDDGKFCAKSGVHGACVVHQQRIGSGGRVSGSFVLPDDIRPGSHWLRFLASKEMTDADGNYLGVKGYTCRGDADFTIVSGSTSNGSSSGSSSSSGPQATSAPSAAGASTDTGPEIVEAGGVLTVPTPSGVPVARPTDPVTAPSPDPAAEAAAEPRPAAASSSSSSGGGFPVLGAVVLALLLAASAVLLLRSGRRGAPSANGR